jgi:hypothetical protein
MDSKGLGVKRVREEEEKRKGEMGKRQACVGRKKDPLLD